LVFRISARASAEGAGIDVLFSISARSNLPMAPAASLIRLAFLAQRRGRPYPGPAENGSWPPARVARFRQPRRYPSRPWADLPRALLLSGRGRAPRVPARDGDFHSVSRPEPKRRLDAGSAGFQTTVMVDRCSRPTRLGGLTCTIARYPFNQVLRCCDLAKLMSNNGEGHLLNLLGG
jgi:hypothetical protein